MASAGKEEDETIESARPSRRTAGAYFQHVPGRRNLFFHAFTKEKLLESLKNLAWVGPLTILIWIYAEREQTLDLDVSAPIEVTSSDHSKVVSLENGGPARVILKLFGPQATLQRVRDQLTNGIPAGLEIDVGSSRGRGPGQKIDVVNTIQNLPLFRDNGVTVRSSTPAELTINVDAVMERLIAVRASPGVTNLNLANTTFDPAKVKVRGPESVLNAAESNGTLGVFAEISRNLPPGRRDVVVPVSMPIHDERITIEPMNVRATLDVRATDVAGLAPSIPIYVCAPPDLSQKFDVIVNGSSTPFITNVNVIGPQELIKQIDSLHKLAILDINPLDEVQARDTTLSRRLRYDLPEGLKVADGDKDRTVEFKLVAKPNRPD